MSQAMKCSGSVVIYARYSTDRQDARSIDDQIRRCRAFAEARGWTVVAEYKDEALSGAHVERPDLQRLLAEVGRRGGAPFSAVLVDDLSRLSRDLGDTWKIVFADLASARVRVLDCTTGMASDSAGARLTFGAMALVNDTFLQLVKTETHRGLEGRAIKGFCTGGRTYGFENVPEPAPPDPLHPRKVRVIDPEQAATVRRVFELYASGSSYSTIANMLNTEGLPAPYDNTKRAVERHGWSSGTIRAMLLNRAYIGEFIWNRKQYARCGGQRARKATKRPDADHRKWIEPGMAIIGTDLWNAVQARLGRRTHARPNGTGKQTYLLSGLLKCAACGGSMSVIGAQVKAGRRYPQFGCSAHKNKGDAICTNGMTISENKVNEMILGALRDTLLAPGLVNRFVERFNARVAEAQRTVARSDTEAAALDATIAAQQARVRKYVDAVTEASWSNAMAERLREEEAKLEMLRRQRAARATVKERAQVVPHPSVVEGYLRDLLGTLEASPQLGRELLGKHLNRITMTPKVEGKRRFYEATSAFDLSVALVGGREAEVRGKFGCGGRI